MLKFIKNFFGIRDAEPKTTEPQAPYKVEALPAMSPVKCGCGRSQSGFCVGLHKLTSEQWATHADNPNRAPEKKIAVNAKTTRAKKSAAKPADKKPAAITAAKKSTKKPSNKTGK
jgi:CDGSH-type Zn-finger protein